MNKLYSELILLTTFEERLEYLKLDGVVGIDTFGYDRYLNQQFYKSLEWRNLRNYIIVRDNGCDLAIPDYYITGKILIHHLNPISVSDVIKHSKYLIDPENLICVSHTTHNSIHYGMDSGYNPNKVVERTPYDTCPWRL